MFEGVKLAYVESSVGRYFHLEQDNVRTVFGHDESASKLCRGEPKWQIWVVIELELNMSSGNTKVQKVVKMHILFCYTIEG